MLAVDNNFILKAPQLEDSQNYLFLREAGIKHVENLARQIWTDYNIHDSGIMMLESLCYAITDLGYRTGFDIKDLLTENNNGEPFVDGSVFHSAKDIFPSHPVTFNDLRKILIDITGVKHAWIGINRNAFYYLDQGKKQLKYNLENERTDIKCPPLNGLYDVLIQKEDFVEEDRNIILFGEKEIGDTSLLNFLPPSGESTMFKVRYPLILKSLSFFVEFIDPALPAQLDLKFFQKNELGVFEEKIARTFPLDTPPDSSIKPHELDLNEAFAEGDWQLKIEGVNLNLGASAAQNTPYSFINVMDLLEGFDDGGVLKYFAVAWKFSYVISPVDIEELGDAEVQNLTIETTDTNIGTSGGFINVNDKGLIFNVLCPIVLNAISLNADSVGKVAIVLMDRDGNILEQNEISITTANALTSFPLFHDGKKGWNISAGMNYVIKAIKVAGSSVKLKRNNAVAFPISGGNALELVGGITGSTINDKYYFFYQWDFSYQPCLPQTSEITLVDIQKAVKEKLYLNRNLCEDFMNIQVLKTEEISVCMDIEVRPDVDLEETLAEIYYQLELYVSPPVNFYAIQELLDKGKTTDQIFEGPLLDHGFIDNEEFLALDRRSCLRTSDIIQIIMDVEGVTAVKSISLLSFVQISKSDAPFAEKTHPEIVDGVEIIYKVQEEDWLLNLQDVNFFAPDFSPSKSKTFFYKNNLPYLANKAVVDDLLQEKRAQQIRGKLRGHQNDLSIPVGNFRDLEDYYPIQNDLPETYYVGENLVPKRHTNLRKAQSNQLKGYLLFFEQILANYLSQLSHIKDLFSWKKDGETSSYFTQKIKEIANIEGLYIDDYNALLDTKLADIIESDKLAGERKNKFLDHLIGRFSEELTEYALMMKSLLKKEAAAKLVMDKQALLQDYPKVSSERGKGFDYRFPFVYDNLTGYQRRVYRLLGMYDEDCKVGRKNFASNRIKIFSKKETEGLVTKTYYFFRILTDENSADDDFIFESKCCESRKQICILIDTLIAFGSSRENWCFLINNPFTATGGWILKRTCFTCEKLETWADSGTPDLIERVEEEILGFTPATIIAEEEFDDLIFSFFTQLSSSEGFHVIENILLRKRTVEGADDFLPVEIHSEDESCQCVEVKDPYSFRATVILPSWPKRFRSTRFRQLIEKTLRLEAPAHIYLRICWINHCEMQEFEECHDAWLGEHAALDCKFKGERPLRWINPSKPEDDTLTATEKIQLEEYRKILKQFIDKLYDLNNVFTVARLHGCNDVSSEEPQMSLNNTSLGSV